MDRWYTVMVQPTLLEPVAVVCAYGNRQTSWQQIRIIPAASWDEAKEKAAKIVEGKVKRGYMICEG